MSVIRSLKFVVERHFDSFLAYPLGLKGVVMGQGNSYEAALADARSAAQFHAHCFRNEAFDDESDLEAAYIAECDVSVA